MADLCDLCRSDPAELTVGDHRMCRDCADDYLTEATEG